MLKRDLRPLQFLGAYYLLAENTKELLTFNDLQGKGWLTELAVALNQDVSWQL
jgi:hypothetical protein